METDHQSEQLPLKMGDSFQQILFSKIPLSIFLILLAVIYQMINFYLLIKYRTYEN